MLLFWRIRYLDSRDQSFKDRDLWLETDTLDAVTRAAVELCSQLKDSGRQRGWLQYRHLFREENLSEAELNERVGRHGGMGSAFVHDYFEDENGRELSPKRMAEILTGNPDAVMFPAGARRHDIDYALADKRPIPIDQVTLSADDLRILGYFARDLREMLAAAFYKDGPGTLTSVGNADPELQTAVTDEEIRSFVTIFRRLYMKNEPAGFVKAVGVFARVTQGYRSATGSPASARSMNGNYRSHPTWSRTWGRGSSRSRANASSTSSCTRSTRTSRSIQPRRRTIANISIASAWRRWAAGRRC